jgi:hypothetical protein
MSAGNRISALTSALDTLERQVLDNGNSFTDEKRQRFLEALSIQREDLVAVQALLDPFRAELAQIVRDLDALATVSLPVTTGEVRK